MGVETGIRAFLYGLQKITRGKFRIDGMTITGKRMKKIVIPWKEKDSEKVLGFSIPSSEAKRILTALGLKKEKRGYIVPSYRTDLKEFPDLVEEVARIYGYEKIPTTLPLPPSEVKEDPFFTYKETLRQFLIHLGFLEGTHTSFSHESSGVEILNPLSQDRGYLRRSLLPGLISAGVLNHTTGEENLRLFEMGTVFLPEEKQVQETVSLGIVLSGKRFPYSWSKPERVDFYDLKGVLEQILSFLRLFIPPSLPPVRFQPVDHEWLEEGSSYEILWESKKEVVLGICGKCTEKILRKKKYEMEGKIDPPPRLLSPLWLMEISLSELFPLWKTFASFPSFRPFSRYPFVEWDLSLLVPKEVKSEEILKVIHEKKPRELQEFWIFDRYEGEGVPESFLSIGVRLRFQSEERTLSLEEVKEWVHRIKENLPSLGITLRYEFTPEGKPVS
jgi:phenylalanyl-tRNA synthetase beta chain